MTRRLIVRKEFYSVSLQVIKIKHELINCRSRQRNLAVESDIIFFLYYFVTFENPCEKPKSGVCLINVLPNCIFLWTRNVCSHVHKILFCTRKKITRGFGSFIFFIFRKYYIGNELNTFLGSYRHGNICRPRTPSSFDIFKFVQRRKYPILLFLKYPRLGKTEGKTMFANDNTFAETAEGNFCWFYYVFVYLYCLI